MEPTLSFVKCSPNIGTNIRQCGTVTICNAIPLAAGGLTSAFMESGDYRVMEALLFHDMEIRMCEAVQNGMYEFLMANKVNLSKKIQTQRVNTGLIKVAPFILMRQYSPINNEYWEISGGTAQNPSGTLDAGDWYVYAASTTNIPSDVRSFPPGLAVYIDGLNAGISTKTAWRVVDSEISGDYVLLSLNTENAASFLDDSKLVSPVTGILRRGTPNVAGVENWCHEPPAYLNWNDVPSWFETTRTTQCKSSLYDEWRRLLLSDNPLYKEYGDLDDIAKNRQLAQDWQKRWVNAVFWQKPRPNQDATNFPQLEDINYYDGSALGLGVVEGVTCAGKRANATGIYEQLAQCGRVYDAAGGILNIPALLVSLYRIMRVREANGRPATSIDIFTDTASGERFNQAMINYYNSKSGGMLRLTMPVNNEVKTAAFGFNYRSYKLFWPAVTINLVTHYFFDDYLTAALAADQEDTARVLWILDFAGIYPGILASRRQVHKTGDLQTLAAVNKDFACVMDVPTEEQTLTELAYTVVVECPAANLIIENFASTIPEDEDPLPGVDSYDSTTTTTTTAA